MYFWLSFLAGDKRNGDKMAERYITVKGWGSDEIVEKKSRFIANVKPVLSEDEAAKYVEIIKKQYWDARHNCYAYQLGDKNQIQRYSDDGEPGGTAGMPILDVLRGRNIRNTIVVVTRYFGGTLLGTGGLVRAYSSAAKAGIAAAGLIEKLPHIRINITVDYTLSGKVQYEVMNKGHILENTDYTDKVRFTVLSDVDCCSGFIEDIVNITGGKAVVEKEDVPVFIDKEIDF